MRRRLCNFCIKYFAFIIAWVNLGRFFPCILCQEYLCPIFIKIIMIVQFTDSIYTERFMGLPTIPDNLQGYEQSQLLNKVENIKNKMYYLIHGTLDDNVHYQQSLMLAKVLEQKDILFRQQVCVSIRFLINIEL